MRIFFYYFLLFFEIFAFLVLKNHVFAQEIKKDTTKNTDNLTEISTERDISNNQILDKARIESLIKDSDRFFFEKNYTECLRIYEQIYYKEKVFSPRMLFQMGFIYEGLGDYTQALYFLNLYYQYEPNWQLIQHIENIAQRHRLKGYANADQDFVLTIYYQYFNEIWITLMVFCILLCSYIFWYEREGNHIPLARKLLLFFCIFVFFLSSFWLKSMPYIIVAQDQTYLMSAPSASSDIIQVINKGHKLYTTRTKDIWHEVYWDNKKAYIRKSNVME